VEAFEKICLADTTWYARKQKRSWSGVCMPSIRNNAKNNPDILKSGMTASIDQNAKLKISFLIVPPTWLVDVGRPTFRESVCL
jgi:hypothetical protein